eukprot:gene14749-biopygen2104
MRPHPAHALRPVRGICPPPRGARARDRVRPRAVGAQGSQDSGAGVARAWRGRGAGYRHFLTWDGAGVARAWRGRGAGISCSPWRRLQRRHFAYVFLFFRLRRETQNEN